MFGLRNSARRARRGTFSGTNLRNAALAGVGMLAWKWWRSRQTSNQSPTPGTSTSSRSTSTQNPW
jgi:hypothetical protein